MMRFCVEEVGFEIVEGREEGPARLWSEEVDVVETAGYESFDGGIVYVVFSRPPLNTIEYELFGNAVQSFDVKGAIRVKKYHSTVFTIDVDILKE